MLEEITEKCTDLIMMHTSPVKHFFEQSFNEDSKTLYQRFAFIRSIILSNEFQNAVQKIITSPVVCWDINYELVDIRNTKRLSRYEIKQISSSTKRGNIPDSHFLSGSITSLPDKINTRKKKESVDSPENRFIKHALTSILFFISNIKLRMSSKSRELKEASFCEDILEVFLSNPFFREISLPDQLNLNSPVLQKKEGYREVYRAWLMFDLASKLIWQDNKLTGNNSYDAGKRDIATLYEYWLFFKLLDVLEELFDIKQESLDKLIKPTKDGLGLQIRSGEYFPLKGIYKNDNRNLNIQFSYNRTFKVETREYPVKGSWTRALRPDYTLSLWPVGFDDNEAEELELIVHIHFDAKYKVDKISEIFGSKNTDTDMLSEEKQEQRKGIYKRADLLKMHAYKDAIRRTGGAYILYPGEKKDPEEFKGFHEIIPGLGAFTIKPSKSSDNVDKLKRFLKAVINYLLNRTSQYERMSYRIYDIHNNKKDLRLEIMMRNSRAIPPQDTYVLIGSYEDEDEYKKIEDKRIYYIPIKKDNSEIKLNPSIGDVSYIIFYEKNKVFSRNIWRIKKEGLNIWSHDKLIKQEYNVSHESDYIVFELEEEMSKSFNEIKWNIDDIKTKNDEWYKDYPFVISLADLMEYTSND